MTPFKTKFPNATKDTLFVEIKPHWFSKDTLLTLGTDDISNSVMFRGTTINGKQEENWCDINNIRLVTSKGNARKVYIAGDCLNRGSQLQRAEERDMIAEKGHELYCPQDNAAINDKANAVQEGLAERIVKHDTDAILWSDTVVIEPLVHAVGTCVELGQLKGMRDMAKVILEICNNVSMPRSAIVAISRVCQKQIDRQVLPHCSDIRRENTSPQSGDRREFGMHAYIYGVCLDLTDGKGLYDMNEIKEILN